MIKQLNIRDLAIIDEIELQFNQGMTVFTGETGAGKSILIDALGLILGDRAESNIIKEGSDKAEITAIFDIRANQTIMDLLDDQAIDWQDDELLVRRVIARDGRSRAFINGSPATAQLLRAIGEKLIDIHGQHTHQSLTKPENQKQLLDHYGNYPKQLDTVKTAYSQWLDATTKLQSLLDNNSDQDAAMSLLRYQVDELNSMNPEPGEYELLDEEHRRLANSNRLLETSRNALHIFRDDEHAVFSQLCGITNELRELQQYDESLANLIRILDEAAIQISEASDELRLYIDNLQVDPERLVHVENRLSVMHSMARKHGIQPQELTGHLTALEKQLHEMQNSQQIISELLELQNNALTQYKIATKELHQRRKNVAKKMSTEVTSKLGELGMSNGRFSIAVENLNEQTPKSSGNDKIEFLVTTNPGQKPQLLSKIASGGELSRISLAIQVIGSKDKGIPSLIFDEVDAGIGGGIAEIVGKLLHKLAHKRQVFCVTHLPQVASQGDHHLQVNKASTKTSTKTTVKELKPNERIEEIARMLGGVKITEQSREHAKEMLTCAN